MRVSGHYLRVCGAQGLTRRGLDLWAVQLLGRWGSLAVQGYVRDAHLLEASRRAASPAPRSSSRPTSLDFDALVNKVVTKLRAYPVAVSSKLVIQRLAASGELSSAAASHEDALAGLADTAAKCATAQEWGHVRNDQSGVVHVYPKAELQAEMASPSSVTTACGWKVGASILVTFSPPGSCHHPANYAGGVAGLQFTDTTGGDPNMPARRLARAVVS